MNFRFPALGALFFDKKRFEAAIKKRVDFRFIKKGRGKKVQYIGSK
jgi:hypothetical protein